MWQKQHICIASSFSWESLLNAKTKMLYLDTISTLYPLPHFISVCVSLGKNVFSGLRKLAVSHKTKEFFSSFHTQALPVKTWLRVKGLFLPTCVAWSVCGREETLKHFFLGLQRSILLVTRFSLCPAWSVRRGLDCLQFLFIFTVQRNRTPSTSCAGAVYSWIGRVLNVEAVKREMTAWEK